MGLARLFSAQASAPVVTLSFQPKSTEDNDSFGSDFLRLGLAAPRTSKPPGRAWRTCPERHRAPIDGTCRVTFGAWLKVADSHIQAAQHLTVSSGDIREQLESWRDPFLASANADRAAEDARHNVLLRASRGENLHDAPCLRSYDMQNYWAQAQAVDTLSQSASCRTAEIEGVARTQRIRRTNAIRDSIVKLRDTLHGLTARSLDNTLMQLKYDRRDLFLLNDMTREAEKERASNGAGVPLRFAIRAGKCVLKPEKSRSRLTAPAQRARREAANLAMLIGLAPGTPVTLDTLRLRGFGRHENTVILNDAKSNDFMGGDGASFFFNRIREMEVAAKNASDILAQMAGNREIRARNHSITPALVGNDLYETASLLTSADLSESLTSVKRRASLHSDDSYQREPSVDDEASLHSTPEPERSREFVRQGSDPAANVDALPAAFRLDRMSHHYRVADQVILEEDESDESSAALSVAASPSPETAGASERGTRRMADELRRGDSATRTGGTEMIENLPRKRASFSPPLPLSPPPDQN